MMHDDASMLSFVHTGLTKINKTAGRKNKELKAECAKVLAQLEKIGKDKTRPEQENADEFFLPFKLACETQSSKVRSIALDSIQKLITYGYLDGNAVVDPKIYPVRKSKSDDDSAKRTRRLIDVIVETVYECSMIEDDTVQLHVVRALLTAVTSMNCQVHDHSLLLAIRACYHIYLMSRNAQNKTTAKATLTQMLNQVNQQMEHFAALVKDQEAHNGVASSENTQGEAGPSQQNSQTEQAPATQPTEESTPQTTGESAAVAPQQEDETAQTPEPTAAAATSSTSSSSSSSAIISISVGKKALVKAEGEASGQGAGGADQPGDSKPDKEEVGEDAPQPPASESSAPPSAADSAQTTTTGNENKPRKVVASAKDEVRAKAEVLQKDAYLLFKALCKLSMKSVQDPPDPLALRSKTLSLELLLSVLENSGTCFRTHPQFINLVKEDLVMSLLKNCVTPMEKIFKLSSSIFTAITDTFKPCLKTEIGVFLDTIFLKILQSSNSTFDHKMTSLAVLSRMCEEPQTIMEMFLNYDCDMNNFNVFQQVVTNLEKIAQGRFALENIFAPEQETALRRAALEGLCATMKSLVVWTQKQPDRNASILDNPAKLGGPTENGTEDKDAKEESEGEKPSDSETLGGTSRPQFSKNYTRQKEFKAKLERGILKFNNKPKHGLKYLFENGVIEETPEAVVDFFKQNPTVDKVQIGDWIGLPAEFNKAVLYSFIESLNFRKLIFDDALRAFLQGFRLPGEPEKIDRMMEKFAEQYTLHNPGLLPSAESAYVLAYAVIMLNTDAHSSQIKEKMTRDQFIRNSSTDGDLSVDLLTKIYYRIVNNEIKMKDDPLAMPSQRAAEYINPKQRVFIFMKEGQQMAKRTHELIKENKVANRGGANGVVVSPTGDIVTDFYQATAQDVDAVEPMFEVLWYPTLATLSLLLEKSDDDCVVHLCLEGYRHAITIASYFQMDTPRLAFINSLKKFTLLGTGKELKDRNIEAIKMLLSIAHHQGDHLKESWGDILEFVSELERLHHSTGQPTVDVFQISPIQPAQRQASSSISQFAEVARKTPASLEIQAINSKLVADKIDWSLVDRVFTQSARLGSEAIVDFVNHLRLVSQQELSIPHAPRVFCLQKIVEITYYNMGRIRLVWTRIWKILSDFFVKAGCHSNLNVSMYAIDSLRQLAMKFLEKDELANYQFQKQFLKPFEHIMANNRSTEIRELVVQCLSRMIMGRVKNVKSGWKSVFVVLTSGAKDAHEPLVISTFSLAKTIMDKYFTMIVETTDSIDECINCLVAFGCNRYSTISLQAIQYLVRCASVLDAQSGGPASLKVWFLLLTGLSSMIGDPRLEVRSSALHALFGTLHAHGAGFDMDMWRLVFSGVFNPIFDDVRHAGEAQEGKLPEANDHKGEASWLQTTCLAALSSLVELFAHFHGSLTGMLPDMLKLISSCISQSGEELSHIGVQCWIRLVNTTGKQLSSEEWSQVLRSFASVFSSMLPHQLLSLESLKNPLPRLASSAPEPLAPASPAGPQPRLSDIFDAQAIVTGCKVQLMLIDAAFQVVCMFYSDENGAFASPSLGGEEEAGRPSSGDPQATTRDGKTRVYHFLAADEQKDEQQRQEGALGMEHVALVLDSLATSVEFARGFNADDKLRAKLSQSGVLQGAQESLPELYYQEAQGLQAYVQILFRVYRAGHQSEKNLQDVCRFVLTEYCDRVKAGSGSAQALGSVVCVLLDSMMGLEEENFRRNISSLFTPVTHLIQFGSPTVRVAVRKLFETRLKQQILGAQDISM